MFMFLRHVFSSRYNADFFLGRILRYLTCVLDIFFFFFDIVFAVSLSEKCLQIHPKDNPSRDQGLNLLLPRKGWTK
jgi:hypothetical protein